MDKLGDFKVSDLVVFKHEKILHQIYRVCYYFDLDSRTLVNIVNIFTGANRDVLPAKLERLIRESDIPVPSEKERIESEPIIEGETYCQYLEMEKKMSKCDCQIDFQRMATPFTDGVDFKGLSEYLTRSITDAALDMIFHQYAIGWLISKETAEALKKILITLDGVHLTHRFTLIGGEGVEYARYTLSY